MQLKPNTELQGGKYRIIRVLGQGGFGITYLAENTFFEKMVAIKEFFPKDFCGRDNTSHLTLGTQNNAETVEKLKARFLKEAKNIAKLDHPGIIKIHDVFEENHTAYYVMDYIDGENLNEMVKRNGPLSESKAIEYITKVGEALEYIHSKNMTHFDVKPANIMVNSSDDNPILIDFGLSKQYDSNGDATTTMLTGVSQGYSPLELYESENVMTFSPQTDVYSLGATLLYLISGSVPPTTTQILRDGLQFPANASAVVCSAIKQAMRTNSANRYKSVKDFCQALHKSAGVSESVVDTEDETKSNDSNQETDNTHLIASSSVSASDNESKIHNPQEGDYVEQYQEKEYEEEPSKWKRFLNWICGVGNLVNANQIPASKKVSYLFAFIVLIIAAAIFPIAGWLFVVATYKYIRASLQRLFFADYLHEWDDAADYSKTKATTIVILILLIPVSLGILIFSIIQSDNKKEVTEYITNISAQCPFNLFDVQVSSASYVNGDVIFTCHSADSIHHNRDRLNTLNIDLWKPAFINESLPHYMIFKDNDIIFKFYNNGQEMKSITISSKDVEKYKNISDSERGKQFIASFMELENTYLPYDLGAGVKITQVNLNSIPSYGNDKEYLKFTFADYNNEMVRQFGDSLSYKVSQFIPLGLPYLAESVMESTDGIGYEIINGSNTTIENVVFTSEEIKEMLKQ
ncbi:MAG: serine/threonine-protein kinase [Bacteroidales bacterium]|nr:serine/threonine-protein kinase [Bacteroidales bacterium]